MAISLPCYGLQCDAVLDILDSCDLIWIARLVENQYTREHSAISSREVDNTRVIRIVMIEKLKWWVVFSCKPEQVLASIGFREAAEICKVVTIADAL